MNDASAAVYSASEEILNILPGGAAAFVRQKLNDKMLSGTVCELNREVLFGTPEQREKAQMALARLGFADA